MFSCVGCDHRMTRFSQDESGRESTGVDASVLETEAWTLRVKSFVLVSERPRTSSSSSHVGGMSGHDPNCPMLSFLARLAGPAGGCHSSGWALVLLARLSLALGNRPKKPSYLASLALFPSGRGHHVPAPTWEGCRATL